MIVREHYEPLFRFAMTLTRVESDARDLTQQTFYVWATKGTSVTRHIKGQDLVIHDAQSRVPDRAEEANSVSPPQFGGCFAGITGSIPGTH
jgi:hypothetical protein